MKKTRRLFLLVLFACICSFAFNYSGKSTAQFAKTYLKLKYAKEPQTFIYVGVQRQKLYLIKNGQIENEYSVSTSRYGIGQEIKSEKTPIGLHRIHSLTGKNFPIGGIIKGPNYSGKKADIITVEISTGKDEITSRAIRLDGMEKGLNSGGKNDSFKREIYIHGTPEEGLIGKPVSHGCIRMKNDDVVELFNKVQVNTIVLILNN